MLLGAALVTPRTTRPATNRTGRHGRKTRTRIVRSLRQLDEDRSKNHLLILGLGYAGTALANYFAHEEPGWTVAGTTRDTTKDHPRLNTYPMHDSIRIHRNIDFREKSLHSWDATEWHNVTHIISTIPPPTPMSTTSYQDPVLESLIQRDATCFPQLNWIGYISTTSVYGNHHGDRVWEHSEIKQTPSHRYEAEQQWMERVNAHIFRCGGIYGPYRNVLNSIEASLDKTRNLSESQKMRRRRAATFRCHVYDLCQSIKHSIMRPNPGTIYNIVDDDPSSRREVEEYAYKKYFGDVPWDIFDREPLLPPEKLVMNTKMKKELQVALEFPTYKDGLDAIVVDNDLRPFTYTL